MCLVHFDVARRRECRRTMSTNEALRLKQFWWIRKIIIELKWRSCCIDWSTREWWNEYHTRVRSAESFDVNLILLIRSTNTLKFARKPRDSFIFKFFEYTFVERVTLLMNRGNHIMESITLDESRSESDEWEKVLWQFKAKWMPDAYDYWVRIAHTSVCPPETEARFII